MNTSKIVLRFMLVLVAFLLPAAVFAQTSNGTIAGTVYGSKRRRSTQGDGEGGERGAKRFARNDH